jgi:hypothetical protein
VNPPRVRFDEPKFGRCGMLDLVAFTLCQRANTRAMPPAAISYIPDFVSLTNTGTEQVLTPQFR